ncbi:hypothetical protein L218DRAFT_936087 [Marasmius fiardii PR-910]|nr:hypothetical protein L218DRAFT_936087 [Marasmius fiardii PR-910]
MFNNSSSPRFTSGTFSIVHGNQYNHTYYPEQDSSALCPDREEWRLKMYREYDRVPAGRIKILRTVAENGVRRDEYEENVYDLGWRESLNRSRAYRVIYLTCLVNERLQSPPFLTVAYTGRDAHKVFKQDCLAFSRIRHTNIMQLRGFNDSDTPMILFHDEHLPVQHVIQQQDYQSLRLLQCYLSLQATKVKLHTRQWRQTEPKASYFCDNVWVQPRTGGICFGPKGPPTKFFPLSSTTAWELERHPDLPVLPTATYNTKCLLEFLVKHSSDNFFLECLDNLVNASVYRAERYVPPWCHVWGPFDRHIANFGAHWTYQARHANSVEEIFKPITEDGARRFTVTSITPLHELWFWFEFKMNHKPYFDTSMGWLSQACSIFSTLNIPKDEWSGCGLTPFIYLELNPAPFDDRHNEASDKAFIHLDDPYYLFLIPPPRFPDGYPDINTWKSGKHLYYWSTDPDGQSIMPESQRLSLRLPSFIPDAWVTWYTWTSDIYDTIWAWQEMKGFDPTTTDFARSLGYPVMEVVDEKRLKVLSDVTADLALPDRSSLAVDASPQPTSHLQDVGSVGDDFIYENVNMVVDESMVPDGDTPEDTDLMDVD